MRRILRFMFLQHEILFMIHRINNRIQSLYKNVVIESEVNNVLLYLPATHDIT